MGRTRQRTAAAAFGVTLGLVTAAIGWRVFGQRTATDEVVMVGDEEDRQAFLAERAREAESESSGSSDQGVDDLVREPLPEERARRAFPQLQAKEGGALYDPYTYIRFRPHQNRRIESSVRPDGEFVFRTNGAGLREADEIAAEKPDLRILVAGDSQTEGYCCNVEESFPNRLEALLESDGPWRSVEVLNAGMSGYSFYNYLGTLERFLDLDPDVFIMAVYAGNDFAEPLTLHHYFRRTVPPRCEACDLGRVIRANEDVSPSAFRQAFRQIAYLSHHPEERENAMITARSVTAAAQRICAENGIVFLCVLLPAMPDVQPQLFRRDVEGAARAYGLTEDQLALNRTLGSEWLSFARSRGIPCVDIHEVFEGIEEPLYWEGNFHLNLEGNRRVARAIMEALRALLEA